MQAKEIKTGTVVVSDGNPVLIEGIQVQTPSARGAATLYKFRGRNVVTRNKVDITLKGTESLDMADFFKREVQIMYTDAEQLHLMDVENYNQYAINLDDIAAQQPYLAEGLEGIRGLSYMNHAATVEV